jgi:hypothetical protein
MTVTRAEIFQTCTGAGDGSNNAFLECLTDQLLLQDARDEEYSTTIFLIYSAALVFFMQAGEWPPW